jgi:hypothetical protein
MLQPAGDLRFQDEAAAVVLVIGVLGTDSFEGDLAVQFGILRNKDLSQTASRMR